jgi:acyl dehydratase
VGLHQSGRELSVGQRIAELGLDYTREHIQAYEDIVPHNKGIHDDAGSAQKEGFSQPFASGTMAVAHIVENLMPPVFGDGWTRQGSLNIAFVRPILAGSLVTLSADIVGLLPRGDDTLVVMKVEAALPSGETLVVGSASAMARG